MGSGVKRNWNWKSVVKIMFFAIIFVFGSVLGFLQSIQDFLSHYLTNIQFNIAQLFLIGIGILGIAVVVYDAKQKPIAPKFTKGQEIKHLEFEGGFSPKEGLRVGDLVTFNASFKGIVTNAHIGTEIRFGNRIVGGCLDYTTFPRKGSTFSKGYLNGFIDRKFSWNWSIPDTFPPGNYEFHIRVHNYFPLPRIVALRLKSLLWLKAHVISSIDTSVLSYPERPIVARKVESVIVKGVSS